MYSVLTVAGGVILAVIVLVASPVLVSIVFRYWRALLTGLALSLVAGTAWAWSQLTSAGNTSWTDWVYIACVVLACIGLTAMRRRARAEKGRRSLTADQTTNE